MKVNYKEQSVELLSNYLSEHYIFSMFSKILNIPYTKEEYDLETTKKVLKGCLDNGHESVLEHINISLLLYTNISVYKGLTRHRHCAFTIGSTNFTRYKEADIILSFEPTEAEKQGIENIYELYAKRPNMKNARDLILQAHCAKVAMTTNLREWRYIIGQRLDPRENSITIELIKKIWLLLNKHYPYFFPLDKNEDLALRAVFNKKANCPKMSFNMFS